MTPTSVPGPVLPGKGQRGNDDANQYGNGQVFENGNGRDENNDEGIHFRDVTDDPEARPRVRQLPAQRQLARQLNRPRPRRIMWS